MNNTAWLCVMKSNLGCGKGRIYEAVWPGLGRMPAYTCSADMDCAVVIVLKKPDSFLWRETLLPLFKREGGKNRVRAGKVQFRASQLVFGKQILLKLPFLTPEQNSLETSESLFPKHPIYVILRI